MTVCSIYNKSEEYKPLSMQSTVTANDLNSNQKLIQKFNEILEGETVVDLEVLKKLAWQGIPMRNHRLKE